MKGIAKKLAPFVLALGACLDNQGDSLTLQNSLVLTAPQCTFDATSTTTRAGGARDVSVGTFGTRGYIGGYSIVNRMQPSDAAPLAFGNRTNVYSDVNTITIDGFNACYELKDFRNTTEATGTTPEATFPSCKELRALDANQRTFFLPASAVITPGQIGFASADILPPSVSLATPSEAFNMSSSRFLQGLSAVGDRRTVIVHLQVIGHTVDNRRIESNELLYPIVLCVGCVPFSAACPPGKHPDENTVCIPGQDEVPDCVDD
ncbi:MAG: hypothetical protein IT381_03635 [Deltaproteobacteria bacterium]|nr:hypothetical protein [Deltaproteobacteria bacterium]